MTSQPGLGSGDHAALMDDVYRYQRYIYDLTRKYYLFGRDRVIRDLALGPNAKIIEVGCGTARNLVRIGRRYPTARLFGLDASGEMLKSAGNSIARAGLEDRSKLVLGYAESLSPALFGEGEPFDAVLFSYSLSMIPDWREALRAASASLRPAGRIHIVDFGDLTGLGRIGERWLRAWLARFHVAPRAELLRAFESADAGALGAELQILPYRYAFRISAPGADFRAVARSSQTRPNDPSGAG